MTTFKKIKSYLIAKTLETVLPLCSAYAPSLLIKFIDILRVRGLERMKAYHKGSDAELARRIEGANAFFEMVKRNLPKYSKATQKSLAYNFYYNAVTAGETTRHEYFKRHGEYPPFFLAISPSMACDLRCFGCYAWKYPKEKSLSREKVSSIIKEAKEKMGIYFITITGGEPTFWSPHLEDLIQEHHDVFFHIYTHGMNIDEATAKRWANYGNVHASISIEGNRELTDERRGVGAYDKITASMRRLREAGCMFGFSITHTKKNHEVVCSGEYMDVMIENGCSYGWFFQYNPIGKEPDLELCPLPQQRLERRDAVLRFRRTKPILAYDFWNDGDSCEGCIAWGRKYVHVTAQGLVEPCVFVHFAVDSIHEKSLEECVNSECFKAMRRRQPFTDDLRAPCPQLDQCHHLKYIVEKYNMKPTHEGAERIVTDLYDQVEKMAKDYQAILPLDDGAIKTRMSSEDNKGGFSQEVSKEQINALRDVEVPFKAELAATAKAKSCCDCGCK